MNAPELEQLVVDSWDFDDPAVSEQRFGELASDHASPDAFRVVALTQVARARGLQRHFDDASAALDAAASELTRLPEGPAYLHAAARIAIERGRVLNSSGQRIEARPRFAEAFDLASEAGLDGLAVDALHMSAIAADGDDAADLNVRALNLAESSDDPAARRWVASLLNNLAWTRMDEGDYEAALALFERALPIRVERGEPGPTAVARWSIARAMRALGRYEDALAIQQGLAADPATEGDGFVHEEIGEILLASGDADGARPCFGRAHELLAADEWLVANEPERIARLRELSS